MYDGVETPHHTPAQSFMDKQQKKLAEKIVLFIDSKKKSYLVYSNLNDLLQFKEPDDYSTVPLTRLNEIKEQWIIKKVTHTKGKLTVEFHKIK